jgi:alpha-galactosidase
MGYPDLALKPLLLRYAIERVLPYFTVAVTVLANSLFMMSQTSQSSQCVSTSNEIVASHVAHDIKLNAAHPAQEWQKTGVVSFCADWQGKNPDPALRTDVRVLWSDKTLYLRYECKFRALNLFGDSDANGRRDHLWDRDVAEAFLQPDPTREHYYKEFEVSPNGMWIDLDVSPGPLQNLKSGLTRSVALDEKAKTWAAELAIPLTALTTHFDPGAVWRANFYRVEGQAEPRSYLAWQPTNSAEPNFHVPSAFGRLKFKRQP